MYIRPAHACLDPPTLRQFVRENPLGLLTTSISSDKYHNIQTSHIPFVLDEPSPATTTDDESEELGSLRGHMARANPQAKTMIEHFRSRLADGKEDDGDVLEEEVLILFNSPNQHYISPKYYQETKPATGKVVPTWNYSAVEVYGKAKIYHDSKLRSTSEYLSKQIDDLSDLRETHLITQKEKKGHLSSSLSETSVSSGANQTHGKEKGWKVSDAPSNYIEILKRAIIGIEIQVTSIEGRFKLSQEMGERDREGVVQGLEDLGTDLSVGVARGVGSGGV